MKKFLSLLLSITMLFSITACTQLSAYAGGWLDNPQNITLNASYENNIPYASNMSVLYDSYKFSIPLKGSLTFRMESNNKWCLSSTWSNEFIGYYIYSVNDLENYLWHWNSDNTKKEGYISATDTYYEEYSAVLPKGSYYLVMQYRYDIYWDDVSGSVYNFTLNYKPSIAKPSNFKVSTRKTSSLKLAWNKVGGVSGYQLQRKSGNSYKTVANTSSTSYTVSNLKSATAYTFRVRAYKTVNSTKYYSGWATLTTPTKPGTPGIKTPSTNKKHQIIAKWNKVARASGYQVQYSKKKNFSKVIATKTVSGQSKSSYTGKNFTKGKTYYVRVRAYKTVNGTKYYSSWSKVKSIKCK